MLRGFFWRSAIPANPLGATQIIQPGNLNGVEGYQGPVPGFGNPRLRDEAEQR